MPAKSLAEHDICVPVKLGARSYEIRVTSGEGEALGPFARRALEASWAGRGCQHALVITDDHMAAAAAAVTQSLGSVGIEARVLVLPAGEPTKSLQHASFVYNDLVAANAGRHTCVVAFGGGVIGDLAGFVAATYARGLPLLMVPTTLLAQVDSSVGGKVGVNHPQAKNIIGAFHQPVGVWIHTGHLATLPVRELRCGLAEVIKYGVILDVELFAFLETNVAPILALAPGPLRHIIARSCALKADVVSQDEREETGLRAILNFGHTIGHAIEAVAGYGGAFQHGEAVAAGMLAECRLAERLGWIGSDTTARVTSLISAFGLPAHARGLDRTAIRAAMSRDKKNERGRLRFVLPRCIGHVELTDSPAEADVEAVVAELVAPDSF